MRFIKLMPSWLLIPVMLVGFLFSLAEYVPSVYGKIESCPSKISPPLKGLSDKIDLPSETIKIAANDPCPGSATCITNFCTTTGAVCCPNSARYLCHSDCNCYRGGVPDWCSSYSVCR